MQEIKKLVYKYPNGEYYEWRGESLGCAIKHRTRSLHNANDYSSLLYPEKDGLFDKSGKFVWVKVEYTEDQTYK